jgi:hypothetical protein
MAFGKDYGMWVRDLNAMAREAGPRMIYR